MAALAVGIVGIVGSAVGGESDYLLLIRSGFTSAVFAHLTPSETPDQRPKQQHSYQ